MKSETDILKPMENTNKTTTEKSAEQLNEVQQACIDEAMWAIAIKRAIEKMLAD